MKIFYSYDATTKLYLEDIHVDPTLVKPQANSSMPKPSAPAYTQPKNTSSIQPVGFHTPKWDGTKWVEAGDPVVVAALKKGVLFSTNNQKTLESIAALEAQQTPRLLRGATLADAWSVTKLKSLEAQISILRKTLV